MKRLLVLPILMLGLSFACDQPYEEVAGYKIGCPLENDKGLKLKEKKEGIETYQKELKGVFFETEDVGVLNGNIETISFTRYQESSYDLEKDMEVFLDALTERWGQGESKKGDITKLSTIENPKGELLDSISIMEFYSPGLNMATVTYSSKKIAEYKKNLSEKERSEKIDSFSDF